MLIHCRKNVLALRKTLVIHTRRQIEPHQRVDGLLRGLQDVYQPLVRTDLELLLRVLVNEGRADHGELLDLGGQRYGSGHQRAGALRRLHYLHSRLVKYLVVERL